MKAWWTTSSGRSASRRPTSPIPSSSCSQSRTELESGGSSSKRPTMQVSQQDLDRAAERGVISPEQARALWHDLTSQLSNRPSFTANHVAYYLGALIVIGAMGWFMNRAWEQFGGLTLCLIAVVYGCVFFAFGSRLWQRVEFRIPAGLLITMAVCMAPLAVYGLERGFGLWPQSDPGIYRGFHEWIKGSWVFMEVATITAGAAALSRFRFPFITAPIAFSLWYLSMDIAPLLLGEHLSWGSRQRLLWFLAWSFCLRLTSSTAEPRTITRFGDIYLALCLFGEGSRPS